MFATTPSSSNSGGNSHSDRAAVHDLLTTFTSYYASGAYTDHLEWEFRFSSFRTVNARFQHDFALLYDEYASAGAYLQKFGWKILGPAQKLRRWYLTSAVVSSSSDTRSRITEYVDGPQIGRVILEHKSPYIASKTKSMQELSEIYHVRVSLQQEKVESGLTQQDIKSKRDAVSRDGNNVMRELTRTSFVHPDFPSVRIDCSDVVFHQRAGDKGKREFEIEMEILPQSVRALSAAKIIDALRQVIMGIQFAQFGIMSGRKWKKAMQGLNDILGKTQMRFPQPVSVSTNHLPALIKGEFAVSEKADGRRSLLYLSASEENKRELFRVDFYGRLISTGLFLPGEFHSSVSTFLLDSEYIEEKNLFLVFDIYYFEGIPEWSPSAVPSSGEVARMRFHSTPFRERYQALQSILSKCIPLWTGKGKEVVKLKLKNMVFPSGPTPADNRAVFEFIHGVLQQGLSFDYPVEGLLLTHMRTPLPVNSGVSTNSFQLPISSTLSACRWNGAVKVKKPRDTTNDFQLGRFELDEQTHTVFAPLLAYSPSTAQLVTFEGILPADPFGEKHSFLRIQDQKSVTRRDLLSSAFVLELGHLQLYEGCIVECCFDTERCLWVALRNRPDKRFPNSVDVVYANWELIHSPVKLPESIEDAERMLLREGEDADSAPPAISSSSAYYQESASKDQHTVALREFNNYLKRLSLQTVLRSHPETAAASQKLMVLDLAIGRGGDLHKYFSESKQIGKIVGIDYNASNLALCQRRYTQMCVSTEMAGHPSIDLIHGSSAWSFQDSKLWETSSEFAFSTTEQEQRQLAVRILPKRHSADLAVLHFALHYFWQKQEDLDGLLSNLDFVLPVGGFVLATCFDGSQVYDFFTRNDALTLQDKSTGQLYAQVRPGSSWSRGRRNFQEEDAFGFEIQVFQRSIHEEEVFTEWLVHPEVLRKKMESIGFRAISMQDFFGKRRNPEFFREVSSLDRHFGDLYLKSRRSQTCSIPHEQLTTLCAWNRLFVFERMSYHAIGESAFGSGSTSGNGSGSGSGGNRALHRFSRMPHGERRIKFSNTVHLHPATYFGLTVPLREAKKEVFGKK